LPSPDIPPIILWQDVEKARQLRSRIVQTLNVPRGYASGLHSLRPCWRSFLNILQGGVLFVGSVLFSDTSGVNMGFSIAC
jgi:hypothetical protein